MLLIINSEWDTKVDETIRTAVSAEEMDVKRPRPIRIANPMIAIESVLSQPVVICVLSVIRMTDATVPRSINRPSPDRPRGKVKGISSS